MSDLEKYINSEDKPDYLIRAALIHYQFKTIHPFLEEKHSIGKMILKSKYQTKLKIKKSDIFLISNFLVNLN